VYLLDTNIVSVALKGNEVIDGRLRALTTADWCISAVTRAELRFGLALRPKATRLAEVVEEFLSVARTEAWDTRAADVHGQLRAALVNKGHRIGDFDEMIAAHAVALGATLVTDNVRHFTRVDGLRVENWIR
jgi:tRNA(fMet)-specific endonuclease VapC